MNNLLKILQYIEVLAREPVVLDGEMRTRHAKRIKLAPTFFDTDGCISCGCCCVTEDNLFTEHEYQYIMNFSESRWVELGFRPELLAELKTGITPEVHNINGRDVTVYMFHGPNTRFFVPRKGREVDRCHWQIISEVNELDGQQFGEGTKFFCGIHPVSSITCKMPHTRFFYNSRGTLSIGVSQYGRNWALRCPIEFYPPASEEQFNQIKASRLEKFRILNRCAEDLGIETWIPNLIEYIESIPYASYLLYLDDDLMVHFKRTTSTNNLFQP